MRLSAVGMISCVAWIVNFRRSRAVADTPTSRVASAPQGYVELPASPASIPDSSCQSPAYFAAVRLVPLLRRGETRQGLAVRQRRHQQRDLPAARWHRGSDRRSRQRGGRYDRSTAHGREGDDAIPNGCSFRKRRCTRSANSRRVGGSATAHSIAQHDLDACCGNGRRNKARLLKKHSTWTATARSTRRNGSSRVQAARREIAKQPSGDSRRNRACNIVRAPGQGRLFLLVELRSRSARTPLRILDAFQLVIAIAAGGAAAVPVDLVDAASISALRLGTAPSSDRR